MAGLSFAPMSERVATTRIAVFLDYQNSWHRTRELFGSPSAPPTMGHVHPRRLGERLCDLGRRIDPARSLSEVRVYRGQPGLRSHHKLRLAFDRQTARWAALDDVSVHTRPLRYSPAERSREGRVVRWRGEEKGVDVLLALHLALGARDDQYDVAVVVSADTDLLPAIEEAVRIGKRVETASWWKAPLPRRALHIPGRSLWNHYLDSADFAAVRDDTDYLAQP